MPQPPESGRRRPVIASRHGVVAASHPLAAAAGAEILASGGNAFDAAVAAAAVLAVVEPFRCGPFGFGSATLWAAGDGRMRVLDFSAVAPRGWSPTPDAPPRGARAVAVGPALAGWQDLISAHGSRRFADVLAPAIALAREGVPLVPAIARRLADAGMAAGAVLRQAELADTLQIAAEGGARAVYAGAVGEKIAAHLAGAGATITADDIARVSPEWGRPLHASFGDLELYAPGPPAGTVQFLLALRLLDTAAPPSGATRIGAVWRALRLAARENLARGPEALAAALEEEGLAGLLARLADPAPIEGPPIEGFGTPEGEGTALVAADRAGNMISLAQSLGSSFGAGIVVPGTGIRLNDALAGAVTLAPVIAMRAGAPVLAIGASEGQALVQILAEQAGSAASWQQAIEAPRARIGGGRLVQAEGRIAPDGLASLGERGHAVETGPDWTPVVGEVQAVARETATGVLTGAADPRGEGMAVAA